MLSFVVGWMCAGARAWMTFPVRSFGAAKLEDVVDDIRSATGEPQGARLNARAIGGRI